MTEQNTPENDTNDTTNEPTPEVVAEELSSQDSQGTTNPTPSTPQTEFSSNEAVNLAAEQSKQTAHRNIPTFEDLPVDPDTANLRMGPNLDDALLALIPLVGVWRGQGQADPVEGESYPFGQQIIFSHDGGKYLTYESKTWRKSPEKEDIMDRRETGFVWINESDEITFLTAHTDGMVEIMYGKPLNERAWELESASTLVTADGVQRGPGKRLFGLMPNNDLGWVDERLVDDEMRPWMSAELVRAIG